MMSFSLLCVLVLLAVSVDALKWKQCGGQDIMLINNIDITPMPLKFPGQSTFTFDSTIRQVLNGSDSHLTIKKRTFLGYIRIPCVLEVGSCTYKDTCTLPKRMMSAKWVGMMGPVVTQLMKYFDQMGVKIDCPVPKQHIKLDKVPIQMPSIPIYMAFMARGDYQIKLEHIDRRTHKTTMCFEMDFSIA